MCYFQIPSVDDFTPLPGPDFPHLPENFLIQNCRGQFSPDPSVQHYCSLETVQVSSAFTEQRAGFLLQVRYTLWFELPVPYSSGKNTSIPTEFCDNQKCSNLIKYTLK